MEKALDSYERIGETLKVKLREPQRFNYAFI